MRISLCWVPIVGLACASSTAVREPPPKAASQAIHGEPVNYESRGVSLKGYVAWDQNKKGPRPGVLVVHEWWGHNEYARERTRMLAKMGYTALAVDMYGDGKQANHPDDAKAFMMEVLGNMEAGQQRFAAAYNLLKRHPTTSPDHMAAIGYCFGGGVVLHMARAGLDLDGVASFHGSLATERPAQAGAVKAKVLVLHGGRDKFVSQEDVAKFKKEMADAHVDLRFVTYPEAAHSFSNPGSSAVGQKFGLPLAYNQDADAKSWQELEQFLSALFAETHAP